MARKSDKEKLEEYIRRKTESKREQDYLQNGPDYHPRHPDDR